MKKQKTIFRYSLAFMRKVVTEIESGKLGISGARKLFEASKLIEEERKSL